MWNARGGRYHLMEEGLFDVFRRPELHTTANVSLAVLCRQEMASMSLAIAQELHLQDWLREFHNAASSWCPLACSSTTAKRS